jgi:ABC-type multidrug transport system fused ATPase/permease subunit
VLLALLCARAFTGPMAAYSVRERQASAELFGLLEERLGGTEELRANGAVSYVLRRHVERSRALFRAAVTRAALGMLSVRALETSITIGGIVALAVGAVLALDGQLSLGQVYLIFAYTSMLTNPVEELMRQLDDLQQAVASIARVQQLFAVQPRVVDPKPSEPALSLPPGPLALALDAVQFAYPDDDLVLRGVSATLQPSG